MELRKEFVLRAKEPGANRAELCREYGITRKTGYKWISRYEKTGIDGLRDQDKTPKTSPMATSPEVVCDIVRVKHLYPSFGPKKIQAVLKRSRGKGVPSVRTVARVLERVGLVKKHQKKRVLQRATQAPKAPVTGPNDVWTVDFKGWWKTKNGERCEPLTVRDAYSRYVLCVRVLPSTNGQQVRAVFEELFAHYGMPKGIQSDNGSPFACTSALGGLGRLSAWWVSLGLQVYRSRPGCPQDNGGHERMHGDLRMEVQNRSQGACKEEEQAACDVWRHMFNHERPHEALDMATPAERYRKSERKYQLLVLPSVPAECVTRLVSHGGSTHFQGQRTFISKSLEGHTIGFRDIGENRYEVWFYQKRLAYYSTQTDPRITPIVNNSKDTNIKDDKKINHNHHKETTSPKQTNTPKEPPKAA